MTPAPAFASAPATVPVRPARDTRVDIIRGWLQLTIFASHAAGSWIGAWLIHGAWGLSDSSEQFVFLSGLMLGSVFARKSVRQGWRVASLDMLVRTWRLYRTQLIVFALFGLMIMTATFSGLFPRRCKRMGWSFMVQHPIRASLAALTTLYQPDYMDILPVFMWCMLVMPAFAWLEARVGDWALAAVLAVYLASRCLAWPRPAWARIPRSASIRLPGRSCSSAAPGWVGACFCMGGCSRPGAG